MRGTRLRATGKSIVAIFCAACFLTTSLQPVSRAIAADTWELWPRKKAEPTLVEPPPTDANGAANIWKTLPKTTAEPGIVVTPATDANGAVKAGDAAGKKTAKGRFYKTIGWIALGIAAVVGIAVAAGGGGDGGGTATNPGHH